MKHFLSLIFNKTCLGVAPHELEYVFHRASDKNNMLRRTKFIFTIMIKVKLVLQR